MANIISLVIGGVALLWALIAFIPFLGWANWFIIPLAVVGGLIGAVGRSKWGRNLNLVVIVISLVRLHLGGGLF